MSTTHTDRVLASVQSGADAARSSVAASWNRSFALHGIDPARLNAKAQSDTERLKQQSEALGRLVRIAETRLDDLLRLIGHTGRAVFLADQQGLVLVGRAHPSDETLMHDAGLVVGADWSEAEQGTNGIGTCLVEGRPLAIHRDQHYLAQNTALSCVDAPVFGPDGALVGALDVSSARADDSEGFNQLIGAMLVRVAQQIETDLFRDSHAGHRIVLLAGNESAPSLAAVDRDDIVVGATRAARRLHGMRASGPLDPVPLRDVLGEGALGLTGAERSVIIRALTRNGGNASAAARELGIGRATLYRRMKALGIETSPSDLSQD